MAENRERRAQKSRTRQALMAAARTLLTDGEIVTVTAAAERAGMSKATAYRYFSDPAILVAEAGLDVEVVSYDKVVAGAATLRDRLRAISLYFLDLAIDHEVKFRQFVGLTLTAWRPDDGKTRTRRGGRRMPMYRQALAETDLTEDRKEAMIRALSTATGAEAMIALYDVQGCDRETARQTVADIADAIIDRYLGPT